MLCGHFVSLSGLALAWWGYHADSVSLFGCGLALVPACSVLRWVIVPPQPDALSAPAPPPAPVSAAELPQPVRVVDRATAAAELLAQINAARQQRAAQ